MQKHEMQRVKGGVTVANPAEPFLVPERDDKTSPLVHPLVLSTRHEPSHLFTFRRRTVTAMIPSTWVSNSTLESPVTLNVNFVVLHLFARNVLDLTELVNQLIAAQ